MIDLRLVQSITGAINAGMPKNGPLGTIPPGANPFSPQPRIKADNEVAGSVKAQPGLNAAPDIAPRRTLHPDPRIADLPPQYAAPPTAYVYEKPNCSFIEPPWKTLPWPQTEVVVVCPKVVRQVVDYRHKGMILDVFV
jgi:hypothetical protein